MNVEQLLGIRVPRGIGVPGLRMKDYEIVSKLQEAQALQQQEVPLVLPDGRKVTVQLSQLDPQCIMDESWWVRT